MGNDKISKIKINSILKLTATLLFVTGSLLIFSSCKKVIDNPTKANVFGLVDENNQQCLLVYPNPEGGFFAITNSENPISYGIFLTKFSESGQIIESQKIPCEGINAFFNFAKDGSIVLCTYNTPNRLIKINQSGKILFNKQFDDSVYADFSSYTIPVEGDDHHFYVARTKRIGWSNGVQSVLEFDENGNRLKNKDIVVFDSLFDNHWNINWGFTTGLNIHKVTHVDTIKTIYFTGMVLAKGRQWYENTTVFVSKLDYDGKNVISNNTKLMDYNNVSDINSGLGAVGLPNNQTLLMALQQEPKSNYKVHLTKVDATLNKIWEMDVSMGIRNTFGQSITLCKDGNYLLCGDCINVGKNFGQPFAVKISPDGKIIWSRIYTMPQYGRFLSCTETANGNFIFGGNTSSLGAGNNQFDMFLIKTDNNGNLQ